MSIRLYITAEGRTEERFVKDVLAPYLAERKVFASVRCALTGVDRSKNVQYRGGFSRHNP